jgi:hypothetical protein
MVPSIIDVMTVNGRLTEVNERTGGARRGSMRSLGCGGGREFGMTDRVVAIAARSSH